MLWILSDGGGGGSVGAIKADAWGPGVATGSCFESCSCIESALVPKPMNEGAVAGGAVKSARGC